MINWGLIREVGAFRWMLRNGSFQFRKRILKRDSSLRLPTGMTIVLPWQSATSTEVYVTNANVDWGAEAIFARFSDRQRDFLDVGSHIGYYAAYLAPRVRRVYAFEPDARNFPALYENARLAKNIEVVEMAISSREGIADFFCAGGSSLGSLNNVGGAITRVPATKIDTFVAGHSGIDVGLVKIDIEGHDLEALRGMDATVTIFQPLILTECVLSAELADLCLRWRYRIFAVTQNRRTRRTKFVELNASDVGRYCCKMLFLVPGILETAFGGLKEN